MVAGWQHPDYGFAVMESISIHLSLSAITSCNPLQTDPTKNSSVCVTCMHLQSVFQLLTCFFEALISLP